MPRTRPDFHEKSFRIIHDDDKFFTRLLSKQKSTNSSLGETYDDVSSAVPFIWESRPGTPKLKISHENPINIFPLTPPPSYYTDINLNDSKKKNSKSKLFLHTLLRRINPKKSHVPSSPSSSSSLASLSCSSPFLDPMMSTTPTHVQRRRRFSGRDGDEKSMDDNRASTTLERDQGGYSSPHFMKKAFLSVVGHRSD